MYKNIYVKNIDFDLLRVQRDGLLELQAKTKPSKYLDICDGLINLLDAMLDIADGFRPLGE